MTLFVPQPHPRHHLPQLTVAMAQADAKREAFLASANGGIGNDSGGEGEAALSFRGHQNSSVCLFPRCTRFLDLLCSFAGVRERLVCLVV